MPDFSVLLVENEPEWESRLTTTLSSCGISSVKTIRSFNEAEKNLRRLDLIPFSFVIIDVRLRKQLFDQGGLALLDVIKDRRPSLPVLLLSAYFDDYPGIETLIRRYKRVTALDKDTFLQKSDYWIWRMIDMDMKYDAFISYRRRQQISHSPGSSGRGWRLAATTSRLMSGIFVSTNHSWMRWSGVSVRAGLPWQ